MRQRKESEICISFYAKVQQLLHFCYFSKKFVLFHIANERVTASGRDVAYNIHLKRMGVLKGVPDYCCIIEGGRVCFFEFKRNEKCKPTATQKAFMGQCKELDIPYFLVYSEEDAINYLTEVLK